MFFRNQNTVLNLDALSNKMGQTDNTIMLNRLPNKFPHFDDPGKEDRLLKTLWVKKKRLFPQCFLSYLV